MRNLNCTECNAPAAQSGRKLYTITGDNQGSFEVMVCGSCGNIYTFWDQDINLQEYYDARDYTVRDTSKSIFYRIQEFEITVCWIKSGNCLSEPREHCLISEPEKVFSCILPARLVLTLREWKHPFPGPVFGKEQYGLTINTNEFSTGQIFDHKFDIITSIHVFEHIPDTSR